MNRKIVSFSDSDKFSQYCKMISKSFCPFLHPAEKNEVLFCTEYHLKSDRIENIKKEIFYYGVEHAERLRQFRHQEPDILKKLVACENIVFYLPNAFKKVDGSDLLMWSHFMIKLLYTSVGIMVGKFWINEKQNARNGEMIPEPPCHFLSIRSAIKTKDPYFFKRADYLLPDLMESKDNMENVHILLPKEKELTYKNMEELDYYNIVYKWADEERVRRKNEKKSLPSIPIQRSSS
ncbi:hypothetical protein [Risungbinella massiliensis]|uniref:hypothetical protein n=1 Tax=Risungbinella massiliensis TaxID=1329796 RepID=UPI00069AE6C0|nr:hypothetical protein [Risungbinella massiliensis]